MSKRFKSISVLFLFVVLAMQTQAQSHWGIKVGVNSAQLAEENYNLLDVPGYDELGVQLKNTDFSFHFGLLYHFEFAKIFFFQPEILMTSTKYEYNLNNTDQGVKIGDIIQNYRFLDFPLQVGIQKHPFQFGIGAVPQIVIDQDREFGGIGNIRSLEEDVTWAFTAGVGMDIFRLIKLEFRYENSSELLGRTVEIENENFNFGSRVNQWLISTTVTF